MTGSRRAAFERRTVHATEPIPIGIERETVEEQKQREGRSGPRRLTILHLAAPAPVGGLERVVSGLATGHLARGHTVHVAAVLTEPADDHLFVRGLRDAGAEVHPTTIGARSYLREVAFVRSLCQRLRPDLVHTHGYRPDVIDAAVARHMGLPTVTTVHGFIRGGSKGNFYEWLQRQAFRRFDAVVAVSRPQVSEVLGAGVSAERVHLVPNALSGGMLPLSRERARALLGSDPDEYRIGWIGRLSHEKGADVFVDALALLGDLPLYFSVVGEGHERGELEARAANTSLANRIRWHGLVERADRLLPAFDVLVLSSRTEGTPMVLLEAMAAGTPIIAAAVGGVPDVLSPREALLVPPEDPEALATAIRTIYADQDAARRRVAAAKARLISEFGTEPWLNRYEAIYQQLASLKSTAWKT